jgi:hypothetical protein
MATIITASPEQINKAEALFKAGKFLSATNEEIENVLRVGANATTVDNHWIVRGLIAYRFNRNVGSNRSRR